MIDNTINDAKTVKGEGIEAITGIKEIEGASRIPSIAYIPYIPFPLKGDAA